MRIYLALLSATALTACGGGSAPQTIGGSAVIGNNGSTDGTGSGGAVSGGPGGGVTTGTGSGTTAAATGFLSLASEKTFSAIGALQSLSVTGSTSLYQGNASTVRTPSGTVAYNPRDGIFTVTLSDTKAGIPNTQLRFQDPAHRTDFAPNRTPTLNAPNLDGFNYLELANLGNSATHSDGSTFFYQRPGISTNYVSLAGYVRDSFDTPSTPTSNEIHERGAMVFGDLTLQGNIPATGTANFSGGFLASMVNNPTGDNANTLPSYFQWIYGDSSVAVDFGKSTVGLSFSGSVGKAYENNTEILNTTIAANAHFEATASASLDLVHTGGFTGQFSTAKFTNPGGQAQSVDFASISPGSNVAGASSVDGAFFGPGAVNVGGNFRIVGGIPDQRVDIQGAFVGAKP